MKHKLILLSVLVILIIGLAAGGLAGVDAAPLLARGTLTATDLTPSGSTVSLTQSNSDGHKFSNSNKQFIMATNAHTATVTMTIVTGGQVGGYDISDITVAVGAGASVLAGPFPTHIFNQPSGSDAGKIYVNWDSSVAAVSSSVTIGVYTLD